MKDRNINRIWDVENKCFLDKFSIDNKGSLRDASGHLLAPHNYEKFGYILDACVGDEDKNKKFIFERDLLVHNGLKFQLVWDFGQLEYYIADENGFCLSIPINSCNGIDLNASEIVGTVHELKV